MSASDDGAGHDDDVEPQPPTDEDALAELEALVASVEEGVDDGEAYQTLALVHLSDAPEEAVLTLDRGLRFAGASTPLLSLRGRALNDLGRFDEALAAFDWALALGPDFLEAQYGRSVSLGNLRRFEECLAQIEALLEVSPFHVAALYNKAEALRLLERYPEARVVTEELLKQTPDDVDVRRQYTLILRAQQETDAALEATEPWIELAPRDSFAHLNRAELLVEKQEFAAAAEAYDAAIEFDRTDTTALLGKVELLEDLDLELTEQRAQQLDLLDEALRIDPRDATALRQRALLLWALDRNVEALQAVERAAAATKGEPDAWLLGLHGDVLYDLHQWADAAQCYEEVVALEGIESLDSRRLVSYAQVLRILDRLPEAAEALDTLLADDEDNGEALAERAEVHRLLGENEQALALLDRAIAAGNTSQFVLGTKGQVLASLNRLDEALAALRQAVAAGGPPAWLETSLGEVLRNLGQFQEAIEAFDRALELTPDDRWTRALRCEVIRQTGNAREALELAATLLAEDPDDIFVIGTRAAAQNDLDLYDEALKTIEQSLEADPNYRFGWVVKANALSRLDRHTEALAALDAILALDALDFWAVTSRARLLQEQGHYAEALAYLDQLQDETTPDSEFRFLQGVALARLGRLAEAIHRMNEAKELEASIAILSELADIVALNGDASLAAELRLQALGLLPQDQAPVAMELAPAAWCSFHLGDIDATVRHYLGATTLDPFVTEWRLELAMAELVAGQLSVGAKQLENWAAAVKACPDAGRAAGIVLEGREALHRAGQLGLLDSLAPDVRRSIGDHLDSAAPTTSPDPVPR